MAKNFANCVAEAVRGGVLSEQEGKDALSLYHAVRAAGGDDAKAKGDVANQFALEARDRERRSLIAAGKIVNLKAEVQSFTSAAGEKDLPKGWQMTHHRRGDEGKFSGPQDGRFGLSVEEIKDAILSEVLTDLEAVTHEFRRGAVTGDLRTQSKALAKVSPGARAAQARLSEVVKVMRGEKTSDAQAQALADAMMQVSEKLRLRFNEAGGSIGKLDGWGGPQSHNQDAILRFGRDAWIDYIMPLLNRDKMVNQLTKRKLTDAELKESLAVVWERITTDGWVDQEKISGVPTGRGALWSQHADHRFLHFKSADAWMTYAKQFGNTNPYISFVNWVQVMSRDIAAMEKFGPNPNAVRTYMKQWITAQSMLVKPTAQIIKEQTSRLKTLQTQLSTPDPAYEALTDELGRVHDELRVTRQKSGIARGSMYTARTKEKIEALQARLMEIEEKLNPYHSGKKDMTIEDATVAQQISDLLDDMRNPVAFANTDNPAGYAANSMRFTDAIWEFQRGALGTPVNIRTANVMATARNTVTATALGSAVLSATTDTAFQSVRRGFVGMSAAKSNPVTVLVETLKGAMPASRREAVRSGLILDTALNAWQAEAAYATKWAKARSTTGFVADRVMALQGLNAWTQGGKHAFGLELMAHIADEAGKSWRDMNPDVREMFERAGFNQEGWDKIRRAQLYEPKEGATFLRPNEIRDVDSDLAQRYIAMILRETRYAIIEPTPTAKAIMLGGTRPGTVAGEIVRGAGQLKTFPITVMMMHMGQTASLLAGGDRAGGAKYIGAMLITGTVMGALAMSLKDINSGRDPRKFFDEATYMDPNFWGAALLQSGGLGIYGDFLFGQVNRFGGGWAQTLAGPLVQRLETAWNLTGGNAFDLASNAVRAARGEATKPTRFGRELTRFLQQNTPSVVWNKLLMERLLWNQFQQLIDPEAQLAFQRQINTRKRDFKQDFWWAPGQTAPSRAPDVTRTFATR
jgi:hypothetical protein